MLYHVLCLICIHISCPMPFFVQERQSELQVDTSNEETKGSWSEWQCVVSLERFAICSFCCILLYWISSMLLLLQYYPVKIFTNKSDFSAVPIGGVKPEDATALAETIVNLGPSVRLAGMPREYSGAEMECLVRKVEFSSLADDFFGERTGWVRWKEEWESFISIWVSPFNLFMSLFFLRNSWMANSLHLRRWDGSIIGVPRLGWWPLVHREIWAPSIDSMICVQRWQDSCRRNVGKVVPYLRGCNFYRTKWMFYEKWI